MAATLPNAEHREIPDDRVVWQPTSDYLERSRLLRFCRKTGNRSLADLRKWAAADIGRYWDAVVEDLGLVWNRPYTSPINIDRGAPWPDWFEGGGFNYVENAVDRFAEDPHSSQIAIIWESDGGEVRSYTYGELAAEVNRFANALIGVGVRRTDRVGIFLPMVPETIIATLGCGKVGAVFTPLFSGYGEEAVASRLRDCEASVLITADAFPRRGRLVPMKSIADAAMEATPTVTTCITVQRTGIDVGWTSGRDHWWHELIGPQSDKCETAASSGNDPYMIIYTSGTTGRPKGAVHVHAGFPIKAAHDLAYCFDLQPDDRLFWLTDLGWMMGPWLVAGGLMLKSTLMIYEGTPDYPEADRLWRLVEKHKVTVFGVAPTAIRALKASGDEWVRKHDLGSLRVLGSTGETWNPDAWRWYHEKVGGSKCPVINYSGGTETGGGILGCFTIAPIKSCSFAGPIPGMDADVFDDNGEPLRGAVGELVVRQPWVGMTQGFWQDPSRYVETYWSRFKDVWVHGDWTEIDDEGYWFIRGRSDDILNVSGKRIGPAEIESATVAHPAVQEAAAIGVPHDLKGETAHVFVVLRSNNTASSDLAEEIRETVRKRLGASMRPERVHFLVDLPKTRNGKIMRRVIRAAFLGSTAGEITGLDNPDVIAEIEDLRGKLNERHPESP